MATSTVVVVQVLLADSILTLTFFIALCPSYYKNNRDIIKIPTFYYCNGVLSGIE